MISEDMSIYDKENNVLPSSVSESFNYDSDDLNLLSRYIYLDCLKKQVKPYNSTDSISKVIMENLTFIITPNENCNTIPYDKKIKHMLNFLISSGVKNIIIAHKITDDYSFLDKYEKKFKFFEIHTFEKSKNKTEIINESLKRVFTDYIVICDDNSLITKQVFNDCCNQLTKGVDFVFPSNRSFQKIESINYTGNYNSELKLSKKEFFNFDYNFLFCKLRSLSSIGGYNPDISSEKYITDELNIRINNSHFSVTRLDYPIYIFDYIRKDIEESCKKELIIQYNLSKLHDKNVLVNQHPEMYYLSKNTKNILCGKNKESKYKISVIMPVYNPLEFFLDRSISSLINQTIGFENIELIIIDDGSTFERCRKLLKSYSEKYDNITVVFLEKNGGAGIARNEGLKLVTSDYITFLDYDDYYVNTICEMAYNYLENNKADIFVSNYFNLEKEPPGLYDWDYLNMTNNEKYLESYEDDRKVMRINPSIWAKTYRTDFLFSKDLKFSKDRVAQDNLFNTKTLFKAEGIVLVDTPSVVYGYRHNDKSDFKSRTLIVNKGTLINRLNVYGEIYLLFEEYAQDEAFVRLNSVLIYWVKVHLLKSDLTYNDFLEVMAKAYPLFNKRMEKMPNTIPKRIRPIFKAIANKQYEEAYEMYLSKRI